MPAVYGHSSNNQLPPDEQNEDGMKSDKSGKGGVPSRPRDPAIDEKILKTALRLFLEHGVEGTNLETHRHSPFHDLSTLEDPWRTAERHTMVCKGIRWG